MVKGFGPWCPNLCWRLTKTAAGITGGYETWGPRLLAGSVGREEAVPLSPSPSPAEACLFGHAQLVHILRTPAGILSSTLAPPSHPGMLHIRGRCQPNPWEGANQQHPAASLGILLRTRALPGFSNAWPDAWHVARRDKKRPRDRSLSCSSNKYHNNN